MTKMMISHHTSLFNQASRFQYFRIAHRPILFQPRILPVPAGENFRNRNSMRLTGTQSMIGGISAYLNGGADYHAVHSNRRPSGGRGTPSASNGVPSSREYMRFNLSELRRSVGLKMFFCRHTTPCGGPPKKNFFGAKTLF